MNNENIIYNSTRRYSNIIVNIVVCYIVVLRAFVYTHSNADFEKQSGKMNQD